MTLHFNQFMFARRILLSTVLIAGIFNSPASLQAQSENDIMKQNKDLIQEGFTKWGNGTGNFFDLLADDIVWTITGNSPISKKYFGRKQFLEEAIAPLSARLSQQIIPTLSGLYADGDMVIAYWNGKAIAIDGIPYENTYSWYMKINKGKIIEGVAFFDTIDLAALWERVPLPKPQ